MNRVIHGTIQDLPDVADFLELLLDSLGQNSSPALRELFDLRQEIFVARAPGRLDVMGGIADYSGSLVLEMPIAEAALVAVQKDSSRTIKILSLSEGAAQNLFFEMSVDNFQTGGKPVNYEQAREFFRRDAANDWAAYVAGAFLVLMRERAIEFDGGARILIRSRVPPGKGVSSSAALEVAAMSAIAAAFATEIESRELALLCQIVENRVVGAPCGVMDQMTAVIGESNRLLALLCQPAEVQEIIEIPEEIEFFGVDSGVRHAIVGADYASVRTGAFMGYRIIAELAGFEVTNFGETVKIEDARWNNYLSNIAPSEFEQFYAAHLPEKIGGAVFLEKYQGTPDAVTRVAPERMYNVRVPTAHAIYEHHRVRAFAELLKGDLNRRRLELLGELMFQSHASYAACGLGESGTNRIVELVREARCKNQLFGAKITGGGSGGTVAILARRNSEATISEIANQYAEETKRAPYIFKNSSPGSAAFGFLKLENVS